MKQYRGYYIDRVVFNNEADVDSFIKERNVESYKTLATMFATNPSMELSAMMGDKADFLHDACGMSYEEIEEIEIEAMQAA